MDDPEYVLLEPTFEKNKSRSIELEEEPSQKTKNTHLGSHKHILVTVIVKQALINASKIYPSIDYDAVTLQTVPTVTWEGQLDKDKLFHTNDLGEKMVTPFGIANFQTKYACPDMTVEELLTLPSIPLKIMLHFTFKGEDGVIKKAHASAVVDIVNWIKEINPMIRKARKKDKCKPIHKYKSYELVLDGEVTDEQKSEDYPGIGKLFCVIQIGTYRGATVTKNSQLEHLLSVENGEKIAQHIYDYCVDSDFILTNQARQTLLQAIEGPLNNESKSSSSSNSTPEFESLAASVNPGGASEDSVSLEEDRELIVEKERKIKKDLQKDGISPNSFYILTDLLCIKDHNPILYACTATGLAGRYEEFYEKVSDTHKRQWGDIKNKCEKRALKLLDLASQIYPGEYGKIGHTWKSRLLQDVPDAVLTVYSPSIASHGLIVDILRDRWNMAQTNTCCGVTCLTPRKSPNLISRMKFFNTPKATFFWNLTVYLLFLSLATYSIVRVDKDIWEFHNTLDGQLDSFTFQSISDTDSFWSWSDVILGDKIFTSNNSLLPTLVGNMTLRQFRVIGTPCPGWPSKICYEDLHKDQSNWETGGSWQGTEWESDSGHNIYGTYYGPLPLGGYTANLPPDQNIIQTTLETLQNNSWIDVQTRAVGIEFIMYSVFHHFYGLVAMFVEWSSLGAVKPSHFLFIIPLSSLQEDQTTIIIQALLLIITFGYIAQEIYEFCTSKEDLISYLSDVWNWFDLCVFVFYFIIICLEFNFPFSPNFDPTKQTFSSLYDYWQFHFVQSSLEAFMVMFLWFRVGYFFRVTQYTGSLLIIIGKLLQDMLYFTALVVLVITGVSVFMDALLRDNVSIYRDWGTTIVTLSYAALGHGEFLASDEEGISVSQTFGNVVFLIFLMFVTILLINLLIALMNNTYTTWSEYATGLWVLQFTELLHRYEAHAWPPPLNLLGFAYYSLMLLFCRNKLYSYRFKDKERHRNKKVAFKKHLKIKKLNLKSIVKHKEKEMSRHTATVGLKEWHIHPTTHQVHSTEKISPEEDRQLDFLITNHIEDPVAIYLLHGNVRHKYLTLLPGTSAWIDKAFDGQTWVACRDVLKDSDKVAIIDKESKDVLVLKYREVSEDDDVRPVLKCGEVHPDHPLVLVALNELENAVLVCESCGSHIRDSGIFCLHALGNILRGSSKKSGLDLFAVCLGCYYRASLDENDKKVQERLSRLCNGEKWWGSDSDLKEFQYMQKTNELVSDLVSKYIEQTKDATPDNAGDEKD